MSVNAETLKKLLASVAKSGKMPDRRALLDAGITANDHHQVTRLAERVKASRDGGEPDLAAAYADRAISEYEGLVDGSDELAEQITNSSSSGIRVGGSAAIDRNHPTILLLKQVAEGRSLPTRDRLAELGFPSDGILEATDEAARVVAAVNKAGGPGMARQLARELGDGIAYDHAWPEPEDTWSDFDTNIPAVDEKSPEDIAAEIIESKAF